MRNNSIVSCILSGSALKPGAIKATIQGAASIPSNVTPTRIIPSQVATRLTKLRVSSNVRWVLYSAKMGTNA